MVRILLTGYTALEGITKAVNQGAVFKILFKPWDDEHLLQTLDDAFDYFELHARNKRLQEELLTLNQDLERRVEQKKRELSMHAKRLQISQKLFESLPEAAFGVSDDGFIVEANNAARALFASEALVGMKAKMVLPEDLLDHLNTCDDSTPAGPSCLATRVNTHNVRFECARRAIGDGHYAYLIYGRSE